MPIVITHNNAIVYYIFFSYIGENMSEKKNSDARIRANNKYNAKTYKTFTVNAKIPDYELISDFCSKHGISKAHLLINSAKYCIEHEIDIN